MTCPNYLAELENAVKYALYSYMLRKEKIYADIQVTDLTQCLRKSYFIKKEQNKFDEPSVTLIVGILLHDIILRELETFLDGNKEILTVHVIPYGNEYIKLYAMCDFLAKDYVLELKTCFKPPEKPVDRHIEQVNAYLHIFNREKGYIVYLSRNDLKLNVFEITKNKEMWNNTISRAIRLHEALERNEAPEPEPSVLCKYCVFKHKCNIL